MASAANPQRAVIHATQHFPTITPPDRTSLAPPQHPIRGSLHAYGRRLYNRGSVRAPETVHRTFTFPTARPCTSTELPTKRHCSGSRQRRLSGIRWGVDAACASAPRASAWWKRAGSVLPRERRRWRIRRQMFSRDLLPTSVMVSSEDICAGSGESGAESHHFTMSMWQFISTICVTCVTLWILQTLRGRAIDLVNSKRPRKNGEGSTPLTGATESKPHQYDVFINHRGPDVKMTFVAFLDADLRRNGFRPFLDAKEIARGRHVFKTIDKALKDACVHVAIFSKKYAESKYCLNELCDMLKSGQPILPIFYHVKPEDLRRVENGPFKKGFEKHRRRGRLEEIEKWKEALRQIGDYRGLRLDEVNWDEEELMRSIRGEVQRLIPMSVLPGKPRYGLAESKQKLLKILNKVGVVGLVGMGGIGKTTLAEEVYNHYVSCKQFERYCFLRDVRSSTLSQLQHQLLRDLGHASELQVMSLQEYNRRIDVAMCQRVVVVVDDINNPRQLEGLLPDIQGLESGSRVVITSRQRDVLNRAMKGARSQEVFEVSLLNEMDSRDLFNRHAFLKWIPSEGFGDLAARVADACKGHALSLEVIGASLFKNEDKGMWMEAVNALQENEDIFGKLRSSYNALPSDGDRMMFQDIACMLIGTERVVAMRVWRSCRSCSCGTSKTPGLALQRLMDRSLVKVDEEGRFRMHDVLRDMGRDMMRKAAGGPEKWTHVWDAGMATEVLKCQEKNRSLRGIRLDYLGLASWRKLERSIGSCEASELGTMFKLHFLILKACYVSMRDGFSNWPRELRWLEWSGFPCATLPSLMNLPSLVVLDLRRNNQLRRLWEDGAHIQLPLLEMLDLSWCGNLEELGQGVGESTPKLKRLVLISCGRLRRLPESMGQLTDLEHLNLSYCGDLRSLPDGIVEAVSLRELILLICSGLEKLPAQLGRLTNLERIDVMGCDKLYKLPASMGGLKILKTLEMRGTRVEDLPADIGLLSSLTTLHLPKCLRSAPKSFQGLQALTSLRMSDGAGDLGDLGAFTALKVLDLSKHKTVTILPKSLCNLKWLVELNMKGCEELLIVEALPEGLERFILEGCHMLRKIPSLVGMRSLVEFDARDCRSLRHVDGLDCITRCYLGGSKVGVAYNNRWLETKPIEQLISWCGDALPLMSCGVLKEGIVNHRKEVVMEVRVSSKAKCIAVILCIVACGVRSIEAKVWRSGEMVLIKNCSLNPCRRRISVFLKTWRKEHSVVQSLQYGDIVSFHIEFLWFSRTDSGSERWKVKEGGVCMVYREGEDLVMGMNSEVPSKTSFDRLESKFGQLVLGDICEE